MKIFTKEWIDALAEKLKKDKAYQEAAVDFDSFFQFIVEPEPDKGVTEKLTVGIQLPQCEETWEGVRDDVDYTLAGRYGIFCDVLQGRLGATKAITMRKLRFKGNMVSLLKFKKAIDRYVEVLGELDNEYEGEYAQ